MKIENIKHERMSDRSRLSARIIWEDSPQEPVEVFFEAGGVFADAVAYSAEAFVSAALAPALWAGERRIMVEGELCPEFVDNVSVVTKVFQNWFPHVSRVLPVESSLRATAPTSHRGSAFFFTGGVDSLAALRSNRLRFQPGHPGAVRDGIIVFNLEVEDPQAFRYAVDALTVIAQDANVTLVPVSTNLRVLKQDWRFWWTAHMGPALCAIAHAMSNRISSVIIASDYDVPNMRPHGSHPLVDPYFSSFGLKIRYDGTALSRLDKLRLLAGWPAGLNNLRVCNKQEQYQPGRLNCGECEKCLRTLLGLIAAGALSKTSAFTVADLSAAIVKERIRIWDTVEPFYQELVQPLSTVGRDDLAQVVERALIAYRGEAGLRGRFRRFDRVHLNGSLRALKRAILPNGRS